MGNIKARVYAKKIQEKGDEQDIGLIVVVSGTKRTALRIVYKWQIKSTYILIDMVMKHYQ